MRTPKYTTSTLWALIAIAAYATQHAFVKPYTSTTSDGLSDYLAFSVYAEFVSIAVLAMVLLKKRARLIVKGMLLRPGNMQRSFFLAFVSTFSAGIYYYCISNFDQVFLSLVLNLFPIHYILVFSVLRKEPAPLGILPAFAVGVLGIVIASVPEFPNETPGSILVTLLIGSSVPVLYSIRRFFYDKWYSNRSVRVDFFRQTALTAIDAPIFIVVWFVLSFSSSSLNNAPSILDWNFALFAVGIFFATIIGPLALQRSIYTAANRFWYPAMFFFGVPGLVFLYTLFLSATSVLDSPKVTTHLLIGYSLVAAAIIYYSLFERKKQNMEENK